MVCGYLSRVWKVKRLFRNCGVRGIRGSEEVRDTDLLPSQESINRRLYLSEVKNCSLRSLILGSLSPPPSCPAGKDSKFEPPAVSAGRVSPNPFLTRLSGQITFFGNASETGSCARVNPPLSNSVRVGMSRRTGQCRLMPLAGTQGRSLRLV
jgi:hypothetical protein